MLVQTVCIVLCVIPWAAPFYVNSNLFRSKANVLKRCSHFEERDMIAVDCYGLDLEAVPQNLRTDIELLQATHNRIRELRTYSFKRYAYLKYLYLDDNLILDIETGTFAPLQDLEVIRLSRNAIDRVSHDLLRLPKMRKIFLDNNPLIPGGGFVGAPASETLESLSLAQCRLQELPPLEVFSSLLELNVSGNNLKTISPQQLAPMCQLHWLDLNWNPKLSDGNSGDGCDCHLLASWIADRNIILQSGYELKCASNRHNFTHCGNMTEAMQIHEACVSAIAVRAEVLQARKTWLIVVIVLAAVLGTVTTVLMLVHICNRKKNRKQNKAGMNNNTDGRGRSALEDQEVPSGKLLKEVKL